MDEWILFVILFITCSHWTAALENGVGEERQLVDWLNERLPKYRPPSDMTNHEARVKTDLFQIVDVDEKNGLWTVKLFVWYYYHSPSASWDIDHYNNTWLLVLPKDTFWSPDITIQSAMETKYDAYDKQTVWASGYIMSRATVISAKMSCSFDITYFPFDTQQCIIEIVPMITHNQIYNLSFVDDEFPLDYYIENEQWELIRPVRPEKIIDTFQHGDKFKYTIMRCYVNLKRRPGFHLMVVVYPIMTIYMFSGVTFLIPVESGEKISFSVTLLLAQIVAYGTLTDIFPESSNNIPLLVYLVNAITLHTSVICCLAIFVISLHHNKSRTRMSPWLQRTTRGTWVRLLCLIPYDFDTTRQTVVINCSTEKTTGLNSGTTESKEMKQLWRHLSLILERFFLLLHVVCACGLIVYFNAKHCLK